MNKGRATPEPLFRGRRPRALAFGTSGLRGLVADITDLEVYVNTAGYLQYLFTIGELAKGQNVYLAGDLRPSTDSPGRSIMRAVARAIEDAGVKTENLGKIPTPALAYYALQKGCPSIMVTGSHIPFDRNGIKFNKKSGEVLKADEAGILAAVAQVRRKEYGRSEAESLFQDDGMFKPTAVHPLPAEDPRAPREYGRRYLDFFEPQVLRGRRIVFFEHSAVGRDLFLELLRQLGAEVLAMGRSDQFIAIDTEDLHQERIEELQRLADDAMREYGSIDAVVSTDGDSDRPLLLGLDPHGKVRFFGGDLLGLVVADYLGADAICVPISANDAVDLHFAGRDLRPVNTRIGSPHVIVAMQEAADEGKRCVVGWEANGGFLTGSTITRGGRSLSPLPTRDAALPLLSALVVTVERGCSLVDIFAQLPPRFSKAGLIDQFPRQTSRALIRRFSPKDERIRQVDYGGGTTILTFKDGHSEQLLKDRGAEYRAIRDELSACFASENGFDDIVRLNMIDGVRIYFRHGDIVHLRPSGNAPQLRIYAVADSQLRADQIVGMGIREPDGLLRQIERVLDPGPLLA